MEPSDIFPVWRSILAGRKPFLSVELTKECPLHCPGCYFFEPAHVDASLSDFKKNELVEAFLELVRRERPLHISIVGGEPLVRYRELDVLLPELDRMGIEVQVVTSAVRPIPAPWSQLPNIRMVVSIDGLESDHNRRRAPATYDRILKNTEGHQVIVHCTVTRQMVHGNGYLREFAGYWSEKPQVRKIWFSLFTPQVGSQVEERLGPEDRRLVVREISALRGVFPKLQMPQLALDTYLNPPGTPDDCIFARVTSCVSTDMKTPVTPCQIGGNPVCSECGCMAAAGFAAIGRMKLAGLIPLGSIFRASQKIGQAWRRA